MKSRKRYEVLTWDTEKQKWTPQQGVRRGPYTLMGLRRALRELRDVGYPCHYHSRMPWVCDFAISVEAMS